METSISLTLGDREEQTIIQTTKQVNSVRERARQRQQPRSRIFAIHGEMMLGGNLRTDEIHRPRYML